MAGHGVDASLQLARAPGLYNQNITILFQSVTFPPTRLLSWACWARLACALVTHCLNDGRLCKSLAAGGEPATESRLQWPKVFSCSLTFPPHSMASTQPHPSESLWHISSLNRTVDLVLLSQFLTVYCICTAAHAPTLHSLHVSASPHLPQRAPTRRMRASRAACGTSCAIARWCWMRNRRCGCCRGWPGAWRSCTPGSVRALFAVCVVGMCTSENTA